MITQRTTQFRPTQINNNKLIIKLNDGSLLVNEYECDTKIEQGVILQ